MQNIRQNVNLFISFIFITLTLLLAACGTPAPEVVEQQDSSTTWVKIADEKTNFTVTGTQTVRYGAGSRWVQKSVTNSGYCGNWFFGSDPASGVVKRCEVLKSAPASTPTNPTNPATPAPTEPPPPTPAPTNPAPTNPTPTPAGTWVKIADEKTSFTVAGTKKVRFGADTRWLEKDTSGTGQCTRAFFGGTDPAEGVFKRCEVLETSATTPTDPKPTDPKPTDPKPTDPVPTPTLPTPAATLSGIGFLGDSNTELYYLAPQKKDYSSLIAQTLGTRTRNYGEGGQTTRVYLGSERMKQWKAGNYAYYVITFGLNDARYVSPEQFKKDTLELIAEVKSIGAVPILVTNVHVDNKGGHYQWDYNITIKSYDDMYRAIAKETGVAFLDVNPVFKAMNDAYNAGDRSTVSLNGVNYQLWDTRIRNTPKGASLVLDNSQDGSKGAEWFHNIHYNAYGAKIVGDQIVKFLSDHKVKF